MKRIEIKNYGTLRKAHDLYEMYNDFLGNYMDRGEEIPSEVEAIREFYSVVFDAVESGMYTLDEFERMALRALEEEGIVVEGSAHYGGLTEDSMSISGINTIEELVEEARTMLLTIEDLAEVERSLGNETIEQWLEGELSLILNTIIEIYMGGAEELEELAEEATIILGTLEDLEEVEKALSNETITGWLEAQLYFVLISITRMSNRT